MSDYVNWTFQGPVYYNGRMDCGNFTADTMARTKEEARRNIEYQYKIKYGYPKNADIECVGPIYKTFKREEVKPKEVKKPKKIKPEPQGEQLRWDFK